MGLQDVKPAATVSAERGDLDPRARGGPSRRRWLPIVVTALLVPVASLARAQALPDSVTLAWTETGDDSMVGTATTIDLRRSQNPITSANWSQATPVPGVPAPGPAGTAEAYVVHGLTFGTRYYFAVRVSDEAGNWSNLSNVAVWDWSSDTTPPAVPQGLAATLRGGTVQLTWAADTEPDLAGYNIYRSTSEGGPFSRINSSVETGTSYDDTSPPPSGSSWYQVTALDRSGNESAASGAVSVSISTTLSIVMSPGYPNPSKLSEQVRIPVAMGMSGAGVRLDIMDAAGRCVRRIDLGPLGAGNQEIAWDGKNDAGRLVAPGIYTAVLSGHGLSGVERLVRVP